MIAEPSSKPIDRWRALLDGKLLTFFGDMAEIPSSTRDFRRSLQQGADFDPRPAFVIQRFDDQFSVIAAEDDMGVPLLSFYVVRQGSFFDNAYDPAGHSISIQTIREDEWENVSEWPRFVAKNRSFAEFAGTMVEQQEARPQTVMGLPVRPPVRRAPAAPATFTAINGQSIMLSTMHVVNQRGVEFAILTCDLSLKAYQPPENQTPILVDRSAAFENRNIQRMVNVVAAKASFPVMFDPTESLMGIRNQWQLDSAKKLKVASSYTFSNLLLEEHVPPVYEYELKAFAEEARSTSFEQDFSFGVQVAVYVPDWILRNAEWMFQSKDGRYLCKVKGRPVETKMMYLEFAVLASSLMRTGEFVRIGPVIIRESLRERLTFPMPFGNLRFMIDERIIGEAMAAPSEVELS